MSGMRGLRLAAVLSFFLVLLAGCTMPAASEQTGGGTGTTATSTTLTSSGSAPNPNGATTESTAQGLRMAASVDKKVLVLPGEAHFSWNVTNLGDDATFAAAPSCRPESEQDPRITVTNANGQAVELRPDQQMYCMIATQESKLPRGASTVSTWTWDGTIYEGQQARSPPAGAYMVTATFSVQRGGSTSQVSTSLAITLR